MRKNLKRVVSIAMSAVLAVTTVATGILSNTAQAATKPTFANGSLISSTGRVAVHDPSIVYGEDGYYYIFGSHMSWAKTKDLVNWTSFKNSINTNYSTIFAQPATWAAKGSSTYDLSGNLWAPDVIYNPTMGKWCMYMSVNGANHSSVIALATADKAVGPYTYQGNVVYSGFQASGTRSYTYTDYTKATGSTDVSRFLSGGIWNPKYGTNAIDPCVRYDENGDLWMAYGSWFGGIYMLKLDPKTGLRDYNYTYTTVKDKSDAYMGTKIAGGYGLSGEGCYLVYDEETEYYYMYLSYCGLDATDGFSGYHLRMYRSKNITGPYTDAAGRSSIYTSESDNQPLHGVKLFGNYSFSSMKGNGQLGANGYMSGGHNSAFVDDSGNHFLVYHTRFNTGNEFHEVRVHQQFMNEDGWLVTAPYEYRGSKISETGYDASEIVGAYEIVNQGLVAATEYTAMIENKEVMLLGDGSIVGDVSGTWSKQDGNYYANMEIGGIEYKGVFFKQYDESSSHKEVMTFTLVGEDNTSIWGSKLDWTKSRVQEAIDGMLASAVTGNMTIPSFGDAKVTFATDSECLAVSEDNSKLIYKPSANDTKVNVTATITVGNSTSTYATDAYVRGYNNTEKENNMVAGYDFETSGLGQDISTQSNNSTVYGVTQYVDAERGNVAYFDGGTDYIQLPAAVTESDDFTFTAWIKSGKNRAWERIFDFGDGEGNSLFMTTHGYGPECVRAAFAVANSEQQANTGAILQTGEWMHVAVRVDSKQKTMSLFMNGQLAATQTITNNISDSYNGTKNYLGKSQYPDAYFYGYMDDVAVFDAALSEEEIQNYMENGFDVKAQTVTTDTQVIVTVPDSYLQIVDEDGNPLTTVSTANGIVNTCEGQVLRGLSEGVAELEVTLGDGKTQVITVKVEEELNKIYGDINKDGSINVLDMEAIQKHLLQLSTMTDEEMELADVSGFDGSVSVLDMEAIQKHALQIGRIRHITE